MIHIALSAGDIARATGAAFRLGRLKNSVTNGRGNCIGVLGEFAVARYLNGRIVGKAHYDIDAYPFRIEVKTKACTTPPVAGARYVGGPAGEPIA